jgi:hypothetical protein
MKATAIRAPTRAKVSDTAAVDVMVGPSDGTTGYKRVDVAISRASSGGLHVEIEVPPHLSANVGSLLAALGVKGRR